MADYVSVDLTTIDQTEEITKTDAETAKDISRKVFIGKAVCVCTGVDAKQEDNIYFKPPYSCYAVLPELTIESVLEMAMPVIKDGKELMKDGEVVMKVRKLGQKEQAEADLKYKGHVLTDKILLGAELEKESTKKRRINIALAFGLIKDKGGILPASIWYEIRNKKIVITTEDDSYTPKGKTEIVKKSKISFDGYSPLTLSVANNAAESYDDL